MNDMKTGGRLPAFSHSQPFFTPFSHCKGSIGKLLLHCNGAKGISNRDPHGYFLSLAAIAVMAGVCRVPKDMRSMSRRKKVS